MQTKFSYLNGFLDSFPKKSLLHHIHIKKTPTNIVYVHGDATAGVLKYLTLNVLRATQRIPMAITEHLLSSAQLSQNAYIQVWPKQKSEPGFTVAVGTGRSCPDHFSVSLLPFTAMAWSQALQSLLTCPRSCS
ncbi:hypothetical protein P7K49_028284 [Saguinus oedipus]|uniref:Uncharacterized protein n=1 Tax=Saguinus oedipus TaxID=9490 RepID=A0ABQ9UC33_SAGOE|nr:hypothetical protein P7K49_028284 [Saguinus oedipus]